MIFFHPPNPSRIPLNLMMGVASLSLVLAIGSTVRGTHPTAALRLNPSPMIPPTAAVTAPASVSIARLTNPPPRRVHRAAPFDRIVQKAAQETGLPASLIKAVIFAESRFNPREVSAAGACGLMQLMPRTAKRFGVTNIFDPEQNVMAGSKHLRYLMKRFSNNIPLALAAYNAGEGPVLKYKGIPPFAETQYYVPKVMQIYKNGLS